MNEPPPLPRRIRNAIFYGRAAGGIRLDGRKVLIERIEDAHRQAEQWLAAWARESQSTRQHSDVENLLATGADMEYLKTWSQKLNLTDMLTRVSR